jgi:hypothetical protein
MDENTLKLKLTVCLIVSVLFQIQSEGVQSTTTKCVIVLILLELTTPSNIPAGCSVTNVF